MRNEESVELLRDCEAAMVPSGTRVTLQKGEPAVITQSLGGSFSVVVHGNMFRIDGKDADVLGKEVPEEIKNRPERARNREELEKQVWDQMRSCYDPEIPVNIVDLGLIYTCTVSELNAEGDEYKVEVKMTLTAPGCGMGDHLRYDVESKIYGLEGIREVIVELVWEPQWHQGMMSEAAQLQLGML